MVPLNIEHSATEKFRGKYSAMLADTAKLVNMTPEALAVGVEMARGGQDGPLHPGRWLGTVLRRLRAVGPDYFLIAGEDDLIESLQIASVRSDLSMEGRRGIILAGCNRVRAIAAVTLFSIGNRGLVMDDPIVLDSMRDGGGWMGRLSDVYMPSPS